MSTQLETQAQPVDTSEAELSYREAVCAALEDELDGDPTVLFMGEDVAAAGGVFKTSEGLSEKFGRERVRNTPICENGFIGVALGMAVTGLRPGGRDHVQRLPPDRGRRDRQRAAEVPLHVGRAVRSPVHRALDRRGDRAASARSTRRPANRGTWAYRASRWRPPARRLGVRPATGRDPRRRSGAVLRAQGALRPEGAGALGEAGILPVGKAGLRARAPTYDRGDAPDGSTARSPPPSSSPEGIVGRGDRAALAAAARLRLRRRSVAKTGRLLVVEEQVHAAGWGATLISRADDAAASMERCRGRSACRTTC